MGRDTCLSLVQELRGRDPQIVSHRIHQELTLLTKQEYEEVSRIYKERAQNIRDETNKNFYMLGLIETILERRGKKECPESIPLSGSAPSEGLSTSSVPYSGFNSGNSSIPDSFMLAGGETNSGNQQMATGEPRLSKESYTNVYQTNHENVPIQGSAVPPSIQSRPNSSCSDRSHPASSSFRGPSTSLPVGRTNAPTVRSGVSPNDERSNMTVGRNLPPPAPPRIKHNQHPQVNASGSATRVTQPTSNFHESEVPATPNRQPNSLLPSTPVKRVGDYVFLKTLGQGTFGKVKLAEHIVTKQTVAIKIIEKSNIKTPKQRTSVEREIRLMKLLHHPHIVQVFDVIDSRDHIMIVMEHASGGELFDYIVARGYVREKEARKFFRQMLSAVEYCHRNNVIHRDLKPENLLLDKEQNIKIIDFGFGNTFHKDSLLDTFCGSPFYAAPEMIRGVRYVGPEVDIWSLGVILFALLSGRLPFDAPTMADLYDRIGRGTYHCPSHLSMESRHLISRMLSVDPKTRANLAEVVNHQWVNMEYDVPPSCYLPYRAPILEVDPEIYSQLISIGFPGGEAKRILLRNEVHPITCIYHLLTETRERQRKTQDHEMKELSLQNHQTMIDPLGIIQEEESGLLEHSIRQSGPIPSGTAFMPPHEINYKERCSSGRSASISLPPQASQFSSEAMSSSSMYPDNITGSRPTTPILNESEGHDSLNSTPKSKKKIWTQKPAGKPATQAHSPSNKAAQTTTRTRMRVNSGPPAMRSLLNHLSNLYTHNSQNSTAPPSQTDHPLQTSPKRNESMNNMEPELHLDRNSPSPIANDFHCMDYMLVHDSNTDFGSVKDEMSVPANSFFHGSEETSDQKDKQMNLDDISSSPDDCLKQSGRLSTSAQRPTSSTTMSNRNRSSGSSRRRLSFSFTPDESSHARRYTSVAGKESSLSIKEVRTIKGFFNVSTTSAKSRGEIYNEVIRVLTENQISFDTQNGGSLFICEETGNKNGNRFEIEICNIERLSMYGLHLKRVRGSVWNHKKLCNRLVSQMRL